MTLPTIVLASDHRGFSLKARFSAWLKEHGYAVIDCGTQDETRCDIGDFTVKLAESLKAHPHYIGVAICGSGQASAMTANRYKHIRAALCLNTTMAKLAREHNDANVLVLGAHIIGQEVAHDCLETFLNTKFLGGRYGERVEKLTALGGL